MATISERAAAGIGRNKLPEGKLCKCCGQALPAPRNVERHRLLFAILKLALEQWPETHAFRPMSTEHLRSWLLVEAGWCTTRDLEIGGPSKQIAANALRFFMDSENGHRFFSMTARGIRERKPKSIAFNKCREAAHSHADRTGGSVREVSRTLQQVHAQDPGG